MYANLQPSVRRGSVAPLVVVALTVFLGTLALAINPAWLWSNRAELQAGADAISIAADEALVDDDLLRGDPNQIAALLSRSTAEAIRFANLNFVRNQPFPLQIPGDLVFGHLTAPRNGVFKAIQDITNTADPLLPQVNAVQATGRLTAARGNAVGLLFNLSAGFATVDVISQSTTMLDQAVVGFRALPDHPIMLAPLALMSDPNGLDLRSWESQVEKKKGTDIFLFDRNTKVLVSGSDGLFELTAALPTDPQQLPAANVAILNLGVATQADVNNQVLNGITAGQLPGSQLVVPATVPGKAIGPGFGSPDLASLTSTLNQLQASAQPRIWPLYTGLGAGTVQVSGFVVARVAKVTPPVNANMPLRFTLQPTMLAATATALTDPSQPVRNRYVCKIRVVQ
jgi:hypothetical protein